MSHPLGPISRRILPSVLLILASLRVNSFAQRAPETVAATAGSRTASITTAHLDLKYFSTQEIVHPGLRFTLVGDFEMKPKMHVYAPGATGFIPISFVLDPSANYTTQPTVYPKADPVYFAPIQQTVPVYQGKFRVTQDVTLADSKALQPILNGTRELNITGHLRYQACNDQECFLPQNIPMSLTVKVQPDSIQHKAANAAK